MNKPKVSVVIPTYNRAHIISRAINSVLEQTYKNWECIIVDDGSVDNTIELLEKYQDTDQRVGYFKRDRLPKGAPTCRNIGLYKAKGDYIIFLDSDDYLLPTCIENRINYCNQYPDYSFLVFPTAIYDKTIKKQEILNSNSYLVEFLSCNIPWAIMCPIWKKKFLLFLKGFSEGYPRFNDPELMIRALSTVNAKHKVFTNEDFDTVYVLAKKKEKDFSDKVFKSLMMFIPDMVGVLEKNNKMILKEHLRLYLHLWFKYYYRPLKFKKFMQSLRLLKMFYNTNVIRFPRTMNLFFRFLLFTISAVFLTKPIDKLSGKAYYKVS